MENFLDGVRTRKRPICDVAIGHRSATVCHLGAIVAPARQARSAGTPRPSSSVGPDSDEANEMLSREMRSPWKLEV